MINRIINILNNYKDIEYKVLETKSKTTELFYVTNKLETNRKTNNKTYSVTIYKNFNEFKGESTFSISPLFLDNEIIELVEKAVERCSFIENKYYELPKPTKALDNYTCDLDKLDDDLVAKNVKDAIFKADNVKNGWINSAEIFINRYEYRIINSNGIDYKYHNANIFCEIIPTFKGKDEEIELYQDIETSNIDYDDITNKIVELMKNAEARANARKLPADLKKCTVILPQEEIAMIVESFVGQLSYNTKFMNMNLFNVGDTLSDGKDCDNMTITLKNGVLGTSEYTFCDSDGIVLKDCNIIKDGIVKNLAGSQRFASYLGMEANGIYENAELEAGSMTFEEMTSKPYLYCVSFSSPQLDEYNSYYGGEVRLGFYFDGKDTYPVSGFSITGNLYEDIKHFRFSKEIGTYKRFRGPKYLLIPNVSIN